jgi:hypothetical protein
METYLMSVSKNLNESGKKKATPVETVLETLTRADLRKLFPIDSVYVDFTLQELELHEKKATTYAASGVPLGNFDRVANIFASYPGLHLGDRRVYLLSLLLKHLDAILANLAAGVEITDFEERALDISVYAKILATMGGKQIAQEIK